MSHNRKLDAALNKLEKELGEATSLVELQQMVLAFKQFGEEVSFKIPLGICVFIIGAVTTLIIAAGHLYGPDLEIEKDDYLTLFMLAFILVLVITPHAWMQIQRWIERQNRKLWQSTNKITKQASIIANQLNAPSSGYFKQAREYESSIKRLSYAQGLSIQRWLFGSHEFADISTTFRYLSFGKNAVYALIINNDVDFEFYVSDRSSKPNREYWTPSSASFNALLTIETANQFKASKFFRPVVLEAVTEFTQFPSFLGLEGTKDGKLVATFSRDFLAEPYAANHSLLRPEEFAEEILATQKSKKLMDALNIMLKIEKYTDNNFERAQSV